jgi:general secretion pathway protein D
MEKDGAAWLAWAKQHGRLEVLGRPQIMTLDNQPAVIKIGSTVSTGGTKPSIDASTKGSPIGQAEIGLTVNLTPRISPEGPILLDLDIERASVVNRNGVAGSGVERMSCRTSTWVKDGQTTILHGLVQRTEAGLRETIIAVTARVSPKS